MTNRQKNVLVAGLCVLFIALSLFFLRNRYSVLQSEKELTASTVALDKAKKQYKKHEEEVSKKVYEFASQNEIQRLKLLVNNMLQLKL